MERAYRSEIVGHRTKGGARTGSIHQRSQLVRPPIHGRHCFRTQGKHAPFFSSILPLQTDTCELSPTSNAKGATCGQPDPDRHHYTQDTPSEAIAVTISGTTPTSGGTQPAKCLARIVQTTLEPKCCPRKSSAGSYSTIPWLAVRWSFNESKSYVAKEHRQPNRTQRHALAAPIALLKHVFTL